MIEDRLATQDGLTGGADTRDHYNAWAPSYDSDMKADGYVAPTRAAAALAAVVDAREAPLLELGCGTGLAGEALRAAGFSCIDGIDFAASMLERARAKAIYRELIEADLGEGVAVAKGAYAHAAAVGVLSPGHAPAQVIDQVLSILPAGGCFVFSLSNRAAAVPDYKVRITENVDCGVADLMSREYGAYLPGSALKANLYVLRRR